MGESGLDESNIVGARAVLMEVEFEEVINDVFDDPLEHEKAIEAPILNAEEKGVPGPRRVWGLTQMIKKAELGYVDWCECCQIRMKASIATASRVFNREQAKVDRQQAKFK